MPPIKENLMNNILFFLMPKAMCAFLYDDYTVRQATHTYSFVYLEGMKGRRVCLGVDILKRRCFSAQKATRTFANLVTALNEC